jgi:hypothetical protein
MEHLTDLIVDWSAALRPFPGEVELGDGRLVLPIRHGVLVAVSDGLGHGADAAAATRIALTTLAEYAAEPAPSLFARCHWSLRRTRGAALSLAVIRADEGAMTWAGVGNVAGVLLRANPRATPRVEVLVPRRGLLGDRLPPRSGVFGDRLPPLPVSEIPIARGDMLALATDGVRGEFLDELNSSDPPGNQAERLLSSHWTGADDALILVARYVGGVD